MAEIIEYFNPNIEDIHVGYECEVAIPDFSRYLNFHSAEAYRDFIIGKLDRPEPYKFEKKFITRDDIRHYVLYDGYLPIRTQYLTGEQIEGEGWKEVEGKEALHGDFKKGIYQLDIINYIRDEHETMKFISIYGKEKPIFIGQCKDINTFRYICKLLNIK